MIHWKFGLIFFVCIELLYRSSLIYNQRLATEPLCVTLIKCPNEYTRFQYHLGWRSINLFTTLHNWSMLLRQCQIVQYEVYLSNLIRTADVILLVGVLIKNIY